VTTRHNRRLALIVLVALGLSCGWASAQSAEEFQKRRQVVRDAMDPDSVLILRSPAVAGEGRFRQDNTLYYLTGVTEPGVSLILYSSRRETTPGSDVRVPAPAPQPPAGEKPVAAGAVQGAVGARPGAAAGARPSAADLPEGLNPRMVQQIMSGRSEMLFLPAQRPGLPPTPGAPPVPPPPSRPGFAVVRPATEFQQTFESALLTTVGTVYLDYQRSRDLSGPLTADEQLLKAARDRGASFKVRTAAPIVAPLRRIKSAEETATLKMAAEITAAAQREAMRAASPGMYEYQIQSIIGHVFTMNGALRPGFPTIVGSGRNSCILHWSENTRRTEPGDVIVMDIGAEYEMYTADITRTIPVSGTFTKRQRDIYEIVLEANEEAIKMVAPGVKMSDISSRVNDILAEGLIKVGLIKDKSGLRRYYTHGLSHGIGLQVHDIGGLGVLEPGMVITIEPGLYIPDENLGVRIEDDVLVTATGYECITAAAPKSVADVEKLMKEEGLDFTRYLVRRSGAAK
jgi:Xaa-Pro aminopeptidase